MPVLKQNGTMAAWGRHLHAVFKVCNPSRASRISRLRDVSIESLICMISIFCITRHRCWCRMDAIYSDWPVGRFVCLFVCLFEWEFYVQSASKAIFRARTSSEPSRLPRQ